MTDELNPLSIAQAVPCAMCALIICSQCSRGCKGRGTAIRILSVDTLMHLAGSDGEESPIRTAACPQVQAASPMDPSTPAMAAKRAEGASPALEAAYERSIGRAQRIQMESLQRQLKVTIRSWISCQQLWFQCWHP